MCPRLGMTEVVEKLFKEQRKSVTDVIYKKTANNAIRELSKTFHPQSKWGFQLSQHYHDFCKDRGFTNHECMATIGRFVGSRHHNQFLPGLVAYNARESLLLFLEFWEGRKTTAEPNKMFTANKKALSDARTLFELEVMGLVYASFIGPMLNLLAGHQGGVTSQLSLVPVIQSLLDSMTNPIPGFVRSVVRGDAWLIPQFQRQGVKSMLPPHLWAIVASYCDGAAPETAQLLDLWEVNSSAFLRQQLRVGSDEERVKFLCDALPQMAAVLRERQPHLVPGGQYAALSEEVEKTLANVKTTSDTQEGDLGMADHFLLRAPSMLVETCSTHIKLRRNKTFVWLRSLPRAKRAKYVKLARRIARARFKQQKARRAELVRARTDKAKAEAAGAEKTKTNAARKVANAEELVWRSEAAMTTALTNSQTRLPKVESSQMSELSKQLGYFQKIGVWKKPIKTEQGDRFVISFQPLAKLKGIVQTCIAAIAAAPRQQAQPKARARSPSPESPRCGSAKAHEPPAPDSKSTAATTDEECVDYDDDVDEDEDDGYSLTCCGVVWRSDSKLNLVCCNKCKDWSHIGPVGQCEGENVTLREAKSAKYYHLCRKCQARR